MSYILEALKKSQQERELGRVPTLASGPFPDQGRPARTSPWTLAAVGLAGLAVLIALYAALGSRRADSVSSLASATVVAPDAGGKAASELKSAIASEAGTIQDQAKAELEPAKVVASNRLPGSGAEGAHREGPEPVPIPDQPPVLGTDELLDQVKQFEAEGGFEPETPTAPHPGATSAFAPGAGPPGAAAVPPDVRRDILKFKEQALRESVKRPRPVPKGGERNISPPTPSRSEKAATGKSGGNEAAVHADSSMAHLRLPPEVAGKLPPARITVHVYSDEPSKRFVVINSLRAQEGDRTDDGLVIEEIRPDGVMLSFAGHRFFRTR